MMTNDQASVDLSGLESHSSLNVVITYIVL